MNTKTFVLLAMGLVAVKGDAPTSWSPPVVWIVGSGFREGQESILFASGTILNGHVVTARHVVDSAKTYQIPLGFWYNYQYVAQIEKWDCRGSVCKSKNTWNISNPSSGPPKNCESDGWIWAATSPFDETTIYEINPDSVYLGPDEIFIGVGRDVIDHFHPGMSGSGIFKKCQLQGVLSGAIMVPDRYGYKDSKPELTIIFVRVKD